MRYISNYSRIFPGSSLACWTILFALALLPIFTTFLYKGFFILVAIGFVGVVMTQLLVTHGKMRLPKKAWPVYLFYILPIISVLWSSYPNETAWSAVIFAIQLAVFYLVYMAVKQSPLVFVRRVVTLIPVTLLVATVVIYLTFGSMRNSSHEMADAVGSYSNYAAAMAVTCIPFILSLRAGKQKEGRILDIALLSVIIVVILSLSRSSFGLLFISVIFTLLFLPEKFPTKLVRTLKWAVAGIIIFSLAMGVLGYDQTVGAVLSRFDTSQVTTNVNSILNPNPDAADYARAAMYSSGIHWTAQHPFIGNGYGTLKQYMENTLGFGLVSHNIIIIYWGGMGLAGLLSMLILFGYLVRSSLRISRGKSILSSHRYLAIACFVSVIIIFLYSLVRPLEGNFMFPVIIGVVYALAVERETSQSIEIGL